LPSRDLALHVFCQERWSRKVGPRCRTSNLTKVYSKTQNRSNAGEKRTKRKLISTKKTWEETWETTREQQGVDGENDGENKGEYNGEDLTKNENKPGD